MTWENHESDVATQAVLAGCIVVAVRERTPTQWTIQYDTCVLNYSIDYSIV